jgi:5-oxoprolinase (ATP-hydrolysing) subunit A
VNQTVDVTCDLGESFGNFKLGQDEEVIPFISSANVGCGFHGGDPTVMRETVRMAAANGVAIGAHFGLPDLRGFGRRWIQMDSDDLVNDTIYQIGALKAICEVEGTEVSHVKAHGALSDMSAVDRGVAEAIVEAVCLVDPSLPIYTICNAEIRRVAEERGVPTVFEVYLDRCVDDDGIEIAGYDPATLGGSVGSAIRRVIDAVTEGRLATDTGRLIAWEADSICFHGDTSDTVEFARRLGPALQASGIAVSPPSPGGGDSRAV